jgi:hypothetical protein
VAIPAIIHIVGEDAVFGELDNLPDPTHTYILVRNLKKKDGKELSYLNDGATAILYAWTRITFIEIMSDVAGGTPVAAAAAAPQGTSVLGFFRDDDN